MASETPQQSYVIGADGNVIVSARPRRTGQQGSAPAQAPQPSQQMYRMPVQSAQGGLGQSSPMSAGGAPHTYPATSYQHQLGGLSAQGVHGSMQPPQAMQQPSAYAGTFPQPSAPSHPLAQPQIARAPSQQTEQQVQDVLPVSFDETEEVEGYSSPFIHAGNDNGEGLNLPGSPLITEEDEREAENVARDLEDVSIAHCEEETHALLSASHIHKKALIHKRALEENSTKLHSSIWSFPPHSKVLSGICGCQRQVKYTVNFHVATLNETLFGELCKQFSILHQYNTRSVFLSLYEQAFAELQFSRYVHEQVKKIERDPDHDPHAVKELCAQLFDTISRPSQPLSHHSAQLVQGLLLMAAGSRFEVSSSKKEEATESSSTSTLIDISDSKEEIGDQPPTNKMTAAARADQLFFVDRLAQCNGFEWGAGLIQADVTQVIDKGLLQRAFAGSSLYPEEQYLALLGQFPWMEMSQHSFEEIEDHIITPLRNLLEKAAPQNYYRLMTFTGKICCLVANFFPSRAIKCLSILTRSPWPMKMASTPCLMLFPWPSLPAEELMLSFAELYHLYNQTITEYSKLPEGQKSEHRKQFLEYIVKNKAPLEKAYELDELMAREADQCAYPLFLVFTKIAQAAQTGSQLQRLVVQELFCFGFGRLPLTGALSEYQLDGEMVAMEATIQVSSLCRRFPQLLSSMVFSMGQTIPTINLETLVPVIDRDLFGKWKPDIYSMNWIAYFFAQRTCPTPVQNKPVEDARSIDLLINTFLVSPSSVSFSQRIAQNGNVLGRRLFECVAWDKAHPSIKLHAALVLISTSDFIKGNWVLEHLIGDMGKQLASPPFHSVFLQKILQLKPDSTRYPNEVAALQVMLVCSAVEQRYCDWKRTGQVVPSEGAAWLQRRGVYDVIAELANSLDQKYLSKLMVRLVNVIKQEPDVASPAFVGLMEAVGNSLGPQFQATLFRESLKMSLSQPLNDKDFGLLCRFWAFVGAPKLLNSGRSLMMEDLVYGLYTAGAFDELNAVADVFFTGRVESSTVESFLKSGLRWLAYAALRVYQPKLPSSSSAAEPNTALTLLWQSARAMPLEPCCMAYWEEFFSLIFANTTEQTGGVQRFVSPKLQDELGSHFTAMAKTYESKNQLIYKLFYAFTTWNKEVIGETGGMFQSGPTSIRHQLTTLGTGSFVRTAMEEEESCDDTTTSTSEENDMESVIKRIYAQLPERKSPPRNTLSSDLERYTTLEHAIENACCYFDDIEAHQVSDNNVQIPSVQQLKLFLLEYRKLADSLKNLDFLFLELTKKLYYNYQIPFEIRVACERGPACAAPATIQGMNVKIDPAIPNVKEDIATNRSAYATDYSTFFNIARSTAQATILLLSTSEMLRARHSHHSGALLFFSLVDLVMDGLTPQHSPVTEHIIKIIQQLGEKFVENQAEQQLRLLHLILHASSGPKEPPSRSLAESREEEEEEEALPVPPPSDPNVRQTPSAPHEMTSTEMKIFNHGRHHIFKNLTPAVFVSMGKRQQYLQMLERVARSDMNGLNAVELRALAARFQPDQYLASVTDDQPWSEAEAHTIFAILPSIMMKPPFIAVTSAFIQYLLNNRYQEQVLNIMLMTFQDMKTSAIYRDKFLARLSFDQLDVPSVIRMLETLQNNIPQHAFGVECCAALSHKLLLDTPAFRAALVEQSEKVFDEFEGMIQSGLWDALSRLYALLLSPSQERVDGEAPSFSLVSIPAFKILLDALYDLVRVHEPLIDRLWYLFESIIFPFVATKKDLAFNTTMAECFTNLPWHHATFLVNHPRALDSMTSWLLRGVSVIPTVFSKLGWAAYLVSLREKSDEERSRHSVSFVRLLVHVITVGGFVVPEFLQRVLGDAPIARFQQLESDRVLSQSLGSQKPVEWSNVWPEHFLEYFNGSSLIAPIEAGAVHSDPTEGLVQAVMLLKDIAIRTKKAEAALACAREVRAVLFSVWNAQPQGFWYLNLKSQSLILSNAVVPLALHVSGDDSLSSVGKELALTVVSAMQQNEGWLGPQNPRVLAFSCSNSYPGLPVMQANGDTTRITPEFREFSQVIKGVVIQFCASAPPPVCLNILCVAMQGTAVGGLSRPSTLVQIMEETLRNLYSHTTDAHILTVASGAFSIMEGDREEIILEAREQHAALTLVTLLEQLRRSINVLSAQPWNVAAAKILGYCTEFQPSLHREYELLVVWFFILDIATDERYDARVEEMQEAAQRVVKHWRDLYGSGMFGRRRVSPMLALAARSIEILYYRLVRERGRSHGSVKGKDPEILKMAERLSQLRTSTEYAEFSAFFTHSDDLLSPLFDAVHLKRLTLQYLAPRAKPLLEAVLGAMRERDGEEGGENDVSTEEVDTCIVDSADSAVL